MRWIDVHCDLLYYLAQDPSRTPLDTCCPCSFPHLQKGNLSHQVLALFSPTLPHSHLAGEKQVNLFKSLVQTPFSTHFLPALENASLLGDVSTSLKDCFHRFDTWEKEIGPFVYMSLTWNEENRFGGGCHSQAGLKDEGKALLEYLSGRMAIDLSHASDFLANDILNFIEKKNLSLPVLASHSNFRKVCPAPRNLPNEIAQEIIHRKGIIGINLLADFVGPSPSSLFSHIEYALSIMGEEALVLGTDFYYEKDLGKSGRFFPDWDTSSSLPLVIQEIEKHFSQTVGEKIGFENSQRWFSQNRQWAHLFEKSPFSKVKAH